MVDTRKMSSFERAIELFWFLVESGEDFNAVVLSKRLGVPKSTLFRYLETLLSAGFLVRIRRGRYRPNPSLLGAVSHYSQSAVLADIARPSVEQLARTFSAIAHFGVLEAEMVTYIVKADHSATALFTRENEQLEAYCSAIGKVLLAQLPAPDLSDYIATAPFPKLTANTIVDVAELQQELRITRARGYGVDDAEVHENLFCLAVPVFGMRNDILGAVSISASMPGIINVQKTTYLEHLNQAAREISRTLAGQR